MAMKHPGFLLLLLFAAITALPADEKAPPLRTLLIQKRRYADLTDLAARYRLPFLAAEKQWSFGTNANQLKLFPEKRDARFNNIRIVPSFAPTVRNGICCLSAVDVNTLVNPLFTARKPHRHKILRIVLDPGHGGKDHGAIGTLTNEKKITLRLAKKTAELLKANGYTVHLTRESDLFLALADRPAKAAKLEADLFVSIHVNAAANRTISGVETFALTPAGAPSSNGSEVVNRRYAGNAFDFNNLLLAYHIQKSLLARTSAVDRGIKRARFAVLRDLKCPGVLAEVGFITNAAEERKLADDAYLDKLARAIADGILSYHKSLLK